MRYLIAVQDNGRGHLTQALTLKERLEKRGHHIIGIIVGSKKGAELPSFFVEKFSGLISIIDSPYFIVDKKNRGIRIGASIKKSFFDIPKYLVSIKKIKKVIAETKPDAIISCYEPIVGLYYRFYRPQQPLICVAHQYFVAQTDLHSIPLQKRHHKLLAIYNKITAPHSATKILLSFTEEKDFPEKKIFVCPPLIRREIKDCLPRNDGFILAYFLNTGYGEEIKKWCENNPQYQVEAFREQAEEIEQTLPNLIFHKLSGQKFIERLTACSAYVSSGGFESICEAAYLQKNIAMIPTSGHFEQQGNALDAQRAKIAIRSNGFDPAILFSQETKTHSAGQGALKEWVDKHDGKILDIIEKVGKEN